MPQPVRISLMRSTAGTASKHSNTQKTVVEDGVNKLPEAAKESPELQEYIIEFGNRKHDKALVAEIQGKVVGVIWVRIMNDYGNIDDDTPSLAMSVKNIEDWVLELYY